MPFDSLKFRYDWHPYQQRVLDIIDYHLEDERLHVVAAPGAGKTTLGLEVFRRLKKPTLVLSPTRVIRDQWVERLSDFHDLHNRVTPDWVSKDLNDPKLLTSVTYQALHSQMSEELAADDDEVEVLELDEKIPEIKVNALVNTLETNSIGVLILDEAHHLRSEWWRALDKVCRALPDLVLVSLTATPPYDAKGHEWIRYEQLCGPIDEEISVPELVKAGNLCAHQDYIWAVNVSSSERNKIKEYDQRVTIFCNTLFDQTEFADTVLAHPWLNDGIEDQAVIREPEIAISILAFLKRKRLPLPEQLMTTLDLAGTDIPDLGKRWWQVLVESVLFSNTFKHSKEHRQWIKLLKKQLRASELLHNRELSLERSRRVRRFLSRSTSKVSACTGLHNLEYAERGENLRQVVLVDFIRDEELKSGLDIGDLNLGGWPVFKDLIGSSAIPEQIALLTGRLTIAHESLFEELRELVGEDRFSSEILAADKRFRKITAPLNRLTSAFTSLLTDGRIKTLVGTRSLLGEGWDAPAINSLVLASSVGSFMLTNQMRGRAIRIDKQDSEKRSSIWHLVAIDTKSPETGFGDLNDLRDRFETFVGLSENVPAIENGFARINASALDTPHILGLGQIVAANNRQMQRRFKKNGDLRERWNDALILNKAGRVIPTVETPTVPQLRSYHVTNTFKQLQLQIAGAVGLGLSVFTEYYFESVRAVMLIVGVAIAGAMLYKLPQTISVVRILLRHLPIDGSVKQIGLALCEALSKTGLIETEHQDLKVNVRKTNEGTFHLMLAGGTFYESSLFADCLAEILAPIENPRYLIVRKGSIYGVERDDFHAVPMRLAVKKEFAEAFYSSWRKYVGPAELIYTRTNEGREILVKARFRAFSSTFSRKIKRQDRWQSAS